MIFYHTKRLQYIGFNLFKFTFSFTILVASFLGILSISSCAESSNTSSSSDLKENYGTIDFNSDYAFYNIVPSTLKGKVGIITFLFDKEDIDGTMIQLSRAHEQFNAREDVMFVTHLVRDTTDSLDYIDLVFERNGLVQDLAQWVVNSGDIEMIQSLALDAYFLKGEQSDHSVHLIVDTDGVIRRIYDVNNPEEVRQLIRHVTALLPRYKDPDFKIKK